MCGDVKHGVTSLIPMPKYEERWYSCVIHEEIADESKSEPDWSRVPESKREAVRARWEASRKTMVVTRVNLWGPQIPFFQRQYPHVVESPYADE